MAKKLLCLKKGKFCCSKYRCRPVTIKDCLHATLCTNIHLLITLPSHELILTTPSSTSPPCIASTMFMKTIPSALTRLWPSLTCTANQEPMALIRLHRSHKICVWKATQIKEAHPLSVHSRSGLALRCSSQFPRQPASNPS